MAAQDLRRLHLRGITSFAELAAALPSLSADDLADAVQALRHFDRRRATPLLLERLRSPEGAIRSVALRGLELLGGARAVRALVQHLQEDPDPAVREQAAYELHYVVSDPRWNDLVFEALLTALDDEDEAPAIRAQAAESLVGQLYGEDQRTRRFQRGRQSLLRTLDHPAPEIRFWAIYTLGQVGCRAALPKLRLLAETDTAVCPGWWKVQDEARDAIQCIVTGSWPDHDRPRVAA